MTRPQGAGARSLAPFGAARDPDDADDADDDDHHAIELNLDLAADGRDEDDDDLDHAIGGVEFDLQLAGDVASSTARAFAERAADALSGVSSYLESMRFQVPRLNRLRRLDDDSWPGNIRELENVLERTILFCPGDRVTRADLPRELGGGRAEPEPAAGTPSGDDIDADGTGPAAGSLKAMVRAETNRVERELISKALDETTGSVTQAAKLLKISRKSLQMKMKEFGLWACPGFGGHQPSGEYGVPNVQEATHAAATSPVVLGRIQRRRGPAGARTRP